MLFQCGNVWCEIKSLYTWDFLSFIADARNAAFCRDVCKDKNTMFVRSNMCHIRAEKKSLREKKIRLCFPNIFNTCIVSIPNVFIFSGNRKPLPEHRQLRSDLAPPFLCVRSGYIPSNNSFCPETKQAISKDCWFIVAGINWFESLIRATWPLVRFSRFPGLVHKAGINLRTRGFQRQSELSLIRTV